MCIRDRLEASHGRAPAVATGIKRANPEKFVFTYQGDGDLAASGTAEIVHAATRGENITCLLYTSTTQPYVQMTMLASPVRCVL